MLPVSTRFLDTLRGPHQLAVQVEAFYGGSLLGPVDILHGQVSIDAGARFRRQLELSIDPRLVPAGPGDPLFPYGAELAVRRGIRFPNGTTELVPVFYGPIVDVDDSLPAAGVTLAAVDNTLRIADARFLVPKAASGAFTGQVADLVTEADPTAEVAFLDAVGARTVVPEVVFDRDRDKAVDDLVRAVGAEWYAQPLGPTGLYTVRRVPTLDDEAVWTIDTGQHGVLVSTKRTQTRDGVYNAVVALGERADGTPPVRAVVTDTNPRSPLRYGGPFGRKPRFYASPLLTNAGQARDAAAALLNQSVGAARQRTISCVPNPALEAGDVIEVHIGDLAVERHLVASITLPLTADQPMQVTTRSTHTTEETAE